MSGFKLFSHRFGFKNAFILLISIFIFSSSLIFAQVQEKLKLAESYEKAGDFNSSARIYEELYKQYPASNEQVNNGLIRSFINTNRFSEALPYIESILQVNHTTVYYNYYAEILWKLGKTKEANNAWDQAIAINSNDYNNYKTVALSQIKLQLFEKAAKTYEDARNNFKKKLLFTDELCQLYIATGNYKKGIDEILNLLADRNNFSLVQGRLSALMNSKEANSYIGNSLKQHLNSQSNDLALRMLYAWFLRMSGDLTASFDQYVAIDKLTNAQGREIYNFAYTSQNDKQYDIALTAYSYIINLGKKQQYYYSALYGYARTLENKLQNDKNTVGNAQIIEIINRYKDIIKDNPKSDIAFEGTYRIGYLYFYYLKDINNAVTQLQTLISNAKFTQPWANTFLLLNDIYISQNKINESESLLHDAVTQLKNRFPNEFDLARFQLAEIDFYRGNIDTALAQYHDLVSNANSAVANDALDRINLIEQNKNLNKAIRNYAKAELYERQENYTDAIKENEEAYSSSMDEDLGERSLLNSADLYVKMNVPDSALSKIKELNDKYPDSIYGDLALFKAGSILMEQKRNEESMKYFMDLLVKYPKSIYLQATRDKISLIRKSGS